MSSAPRAVIAVLSLFPVVPATASAVGGERTPRVLVIGIDGCRPDALQAAATPNVDALVAGGAVSWEAQTVDITVSGPSWSSMLTGVDRDKHGVTSNGFSDPSYDDYPHFFTRVKQFDPGLVTASIVNWSPINTEILRDGDIVETGLSDAGVAATAVELLSARDPDVVFLHFDEVDGAGHGCCFSPTDASYLAEIEEKDALIGDVVAAVRGRATIEREDWLIIVSTDHGGSGTSHGANTPEHRTIFVIVSGDAACRGTIEPAPMIMDVPVTALAHLGVPIDPDWNLDGSAVGLGSDCVRGTCPRSLSCRVRSETVELSWEPGVDLDAAGYELLRNGERIASLNTDARSHVDDISALDREAGGDLRYALAVVGSEVPGRCRALRCGVMLPPSDALLFDDFESYADDAAVEAAGWRIVEVNSPVEDSAWTITNPGSRANPPTRDGTPSTGRFLISDSDAQSGSNPPGSGMSHDLWSPVFSCEGEDAVWLHADLSVQLNNNGEAIFDLDATTDGGATWTNLFRRIAPARSVAPRPTIRTADGFFGRFDLDLSSVAAGELAVRFRLRHFEPNFDWWIAVDNVLVDTSAPPTGGDEALLPVESFAAGIPPSWTVRSGAGNTGTETWHTSDKGGRYERLTVSERGMNRLNHPRLRTEFAILESEFDPDPREDEYLITPVVDLSGVDEVFLHFKSELVPAATEEVLLSLDGGATFLEEPIFSYAGGGLRDPGEEPLYAERVLSVPAAAGESQVAVAFHYESGGNAQWWAIDDVAITGTRRGGGQIPGDCNADGGLDLSDALCILNFLFIAVVDTLPCDEGRDWDPANVVLLSFNGDGHVGLSDAVAVINRLFLGGPPHVLGEACTRIEGCPEGCVP